jgi:hypothetical protein
MLPGFNHELAIQNAAADQRFLHTFGIWILMAVLVYTLIGIIAVQRKQTTPTAKAIWHYATLGLLIGHVLLLAHLNWGVTYLASQFTVGIAIKALLLLMVALWLSRRNERKLGRY